MPTPATHTAPPATGPQKKSSKGQEALLAAAVSLFAELGLKGTSARLLSGQAGVNIAAISYHFGGKEGLYRAVLAHITKEVTSRMAPVWLQAESALAQCSSTPHGKAQALAALHGMMMGFAAFFLEETRVHDWGRIILREQIDPSPAFSILYEGYMQRVLTLLAGLVACCTGANAEDESVRVRVHLLLGQVLGIFAGREALLRSLAVTALSTAHKDLIYNLLWAHTQAALNVHGATLPTQAAPCNQAE
ncbi:CerR family C-terminal domain-containing protein [Desulfovibrio cuneatus]|uniref:CerR family C-terminal domain-containing protein n=1 Tax=Desulfovibrio cuneatus TaxID=159728 RepID=UPI000402EE4C|nr:CerR family C-terminal domain-containing protein [Desulfovibrio cuneatus]